MSEGCCGLERQGGREGGMRGETQKWKKGGADIPREKNRDKWVKIETENQKNEAEIERDRDLKRQKEI